MTEASLTCKCGKQKNRIADGRISDPCPTCGKSYIGVYNDKTFTIEAVLVNYPPEIVAFFKKDVKIKGFWEVSRSVSGALPSPFNQFINKLKKKENDVTYTVSFKLKKKEV